jgi:hypothetical protein
MSHQVNINNTFTPGRYYVGDLKSILSTDEWTEVLCIIASQIHGRGIEGVFELSDGRQFGILRTGIDTGKFLGSRGTYVVDSGTIGCIKYDGPVVLDGTIIEFDELFHIRNSNGNMAFGNEWIDTTGYSDDWGTYGYDHER